MLWQICFEFIVIKVTLVDLFCTVSLLLQLSFQAKPVHKPLFSEHCLQGVSNFSGLIIIIFIIIIYILLYYYLYITYYYIYYIFDDIYIADYFGTEFKKLKFIFVSHNCHWKQTYGYCQNCITGNKWVKILIDKKCFTKRNNELTGSYLSLNYNLVSAFYNFKHLRGDFKLNLYKNYWHKT